jgi:intein/homing endonuclease
MVRLAGVLSRYLERGLIPSLVTRVIVRTERVREVALDYASRIREALTQAGILRTLAQRFQALGLIAEIGDITTHILAVKEIPRFKLTAFPATLRILEELEADRRIEKVYPDRIVTILEYPTVSKDQVFLDKVTKKPFTTTYYTRKILGAEQANKEGYTGKGVKVAVIDTTAAPQHTAILHAIPRTTIRGIYTDTNGHGIWCTAAIGGRYYIDTVYGVPTQGLAPDATLFTIKALYSPLGFGNESDILEAMDLAVTLRADIVSMSLGSEQVPSSPEDDPQIQAVEKLTKENNTIFCIAAGNCLPKDTIVYCNPSPKTIAEIKTGDFIYSFEGEIMKEPINHHNRSRIVLKATPSVRRVLRVIFNGVKPVYEVRTNTRRIRATANHPFLVLKGDVKEGKKTFKYEYRLEWTPLERLKVGDVILVLRKLPSSPKSLFNKDFVYLAGFFLGNGWSRRGKEVYLSVCQNDPAYRKVAKCLRKLGYRFSPSKNYICIYSAELARKLESLGLVKPCLEKRVPDWVFSLPDDLKIKFIMGYLDSDGHSRIVKSHTGEKHIYEWSFESPNKMLIEGIRHLLIWLGVRVTNIAERTKKEATIFNGYKWYHYKNYKTYYFRAYPWSKRVKSLGFNLQPERLPRKLPDGLCNKFFAFEQVKKITYIGEDEVFDIEVEGSHNFIAEGIVVHNSGPGYGTINSPGAADSAITVGAYCPITGKVASFSSRGPTPWGTTKPDIIMPGVNILAPTVGLLDALEMPRGAVRSSALSGTSMATPHASGLIALMVEYAGRHGVRLTTEMVKDLMSRYGEDVKNNDSGWGVLTWDKWKRYAGEVLGI